MSARVVLVFPDSAAVDAVAAELSLHLTTARTHYREQPLESSAHELMARARHAAQVFSAAMSSTTLTDALLSAARQAETVLARGKWLEGSADPEALALYALRAAIARAEKL